MLRLFVSCFIFLFLVKVHLKGQKTEFNYIEPIYSVSPIIDLGDSWQDRVDNYWQIGVRKKHFDLTTPYSITHDLIIESLQSSLVSNIDSKHLLTKSSLIYRPLLTLTRFSSDIDERKPFCSILIGPSFGYNFSDEVTTFENDRWINDADLLKVRSFDTQLHFAFSIDTDVFGETGSAHNSLTLGIDLPIFINSNLISGDSKLTLQATKFHLTYNQNIDKIFANNKSISLASKWHSAKNDLIPPLSNHTEVRKKFYGTPSLHFLIDTEKDSVLVKPMNEEMVTKLSPATSFSVGYNIHYDFFVDKRYSNSKKDTVTHDSLGLIVNNIGSKSIQSSQNDIGILAGIHYRNLASTSNIQNARRVYNSGFWLESGLNLSFTTGSQKSRIWHHLTFGAALKILSKPMYFGSSGNIEGTTSHLKDLSWFIGYSFSKIASVKLEFFDYESANRKSFLERSRLYIGFGF